MRSSDPDLNYVPKSARARRVALVYWVLAALVYIGLGVLAPPVFLLGFQESLLYVFIVTLLAPRVLRRFE